MRRGRFLVPGLEPGGPYSVTVRRIGAMDVDGSNLRPVAIGTKPAWSPDGGRLAFNGEGGVRVTDLVTGEERLAARGVDPSWSPDGVEVLSVTEVGIVATRLGDGEACVLRLHGSLIPGVPLAEAVWSPDGAVIAFVVTTDFESRPGKIHLMLSNGSLATGLTPKDGIQYNEWSPAWSPDGEEVAFFMALTGLVAVSRVGGPPRRLATVNGWGQAWSPDGKVILYTQNEPGAEQPSIREVRLGGGAPRRFLEDASWPAWAPDGRRIAFVRQQR